jgi:uncharacterized protein YjbI with pentapeptide repeats
MGALKSAEQPRPMASMLRPCVRMLTLLIGIGVACAQPACDDTQDGDVAADAECGVDRVRDEADLANPSSKPVCPGQTIIAGLLPGRDLVVSFRLPARRAVSYCFEDDDRERHTLAVFGENALDSPPFFTVQAGTPCREETLPQGNYTLKVSHALAKGVVDLDPDVIVSSFDGARGGGIPRWTIAVNAARAEQFDELEAPTLSEGPEGRTAGLVGDFRRVSIGRLRCNAPRCTLGLLGSPSSFEGSTISNIQTPPKTKLFVGQYRYAPGTTTSRGFEPALGFARAFIRFDAPGSVLELANVSGATIAGVVGSVRASVIRMPRDTSPFEVKPLPDTRNWLFDTSFYLSAQLESEISGAQLSPLSYSTALASSSGVLVRGNLVHVNSSSWDPLERRGVLARADAPVQTFSNKDNDFLFNGRPDGYQDISFANARMTDFDFGCTAVASAFHPRAFEGAQLENSSMAGCKFAPSAELSYLHGVRARAAKLDGVRINAVASFDATTVRDLDVSEASLKQAQLIDSTSVDPARPGFVRLNMRRADATGAILQGSFERLNADDATLTSVQFKGSFEGASLARAVLDRATLGVGEFSAFSRADFGSITMRSARMGALFRGARFDNAFLEDVDFGRSRFDGASFAGAWLCGANLLNATMTGVDLSGAVVPSNDALYRRNGRDVICGGVAGFERLRVAAIAKCPDGGPGPCSTDARWVPLDVVAECPPLATRGGRKARGVACATRCACQSFSCSVEGTCN